MGGVYDGEEKVTAMPKGVCKYIQEDVSYLHSILIFFGPNEENVISCISASITTDVTIDHKNMPSLFFSCFYFLNFIFSFLLNLLVTLVNKIK